MEPMWNHKDRKPQGIQGPSLFHTKPLLLFVLDIRAIHKIVFKIVSGLKKKIRLEKKKNLSNLAGL
jgi:hypothetical protein